MLNLKLSVNSAYSTVSSIASTSTGVSGAYSEAISLTSDRISGTPSHKVDLTVVCCPK